jgi:hypothetical protein
MKIVQLLTHNKLETVPLFDLPAVELAKTYAPGKWNVRQLLIHLADAESMLCNRIKQTIAEQNPALPGFDQDLWVSELDYANYPMDLAKRCFLSARETVIYLAGLHYANSESRTFVHSETGLRTLKQEFDKVALHNSTHLQQIREALAK